MPSTRPENAVSMRPTPGARLPEHAGPYAPPVPTRLRLNRTVESLREPAVLNRSAEPDQLAGKVLAGGEAARHGTAVTVGIDRLTSHVMARDQIGQCLFRQPAAGVGALAETQVWCSSGASTPHRIVGNGSCLPRARPAQGQGANP